MDFITLTLIHLDIYFPYVHSIVMGEEKKHYMFPNHYHYSYSSPNHYHKNAIISPNLITIYIYIYIYMDHICWFWHPHLFTRGLASQCHDVTFASAERAEGGAAIGGDLADGESVSAGGRKTASFIHQTSGFFYEFTTGWWFGTWILWLSIYWE